MLEKTLANLTTLNVARSRLHFSFCNFLKYLLFFKIRCLSKMHSVSGYTKFCCSILRPQDRIAFLLICVKKYSITTIYLFITAIHLDSSIHIFFYTQTCLPGNRSAACSYKWRGWVYKKIHGTVVVSSSYQPSKLLSRDVMTLQFRPTAFLTTQRRKHNEWQSCIQMSHGHTFSLSQTVTICLWLLQAAFAVGNFTAY